MHRPVATVIAATGTLALALTLTGCSSTPTIAGMWSASDGTATKVINGNGECSGMYYNAGKVLDIGGGETCNLSSTQTNGYYSLVVSQPPNSTSYAVTFVGNKMTIFDGATKIVTLTKQ